MPSLLELERAVADVVPTEAFQTELAALLTHYAGRPTALTFAERVTRSVGGAQIWLKREDLTHTGAHKVNNCLGQVLLARHMGRTRII
ncbi:MAG: tryptophan synthase subunit beta, partial [Myxococcota bacterium]|nr:tryptophan synthase subunit beta [Myxococcota bacterium]